jgi:hypothetical protein
MACYTYFFGKGQTVATVKQVWCLADNIGKQYRLFGKQYWLFGEQYRLFGEQYRLFGGQTISVIYLKFNPSSTC